MNTNACSAPVFSYFNNITIFGYFTTLQYFDARMEITFFEIYCVRHPLFVCDQFIAIPPMGD